MYLVYGRRLDSLRPPAQALSAIVRKEYARSISSGLKGTCLKFIDKHDRIPHADYFITITFFRRIASVSDVSVELPFVRMFGTVL